MDRTSQAVQSQIRAMGAQVFEVGLFKPSAQEQGQAVMIPRTWDRDTVLRSIPWLRLQNADGRNIYIRPKGEHDLSLVDDLTADAVKRMKATGLCAGSSCGDLSRQLSGLAQTSPATSP